MSIGFTADPYLLIEVIPVTEALDHPGKTREEPKYVGFEYHVFLTGQPSCDAYRYVD